MHVKIINIKNFLSNLFKKDFRLKLKNCEIINELFYIRKRLFIFYYSILKIKIIKFFHDFLLNEHVDKTFIYNKINLYYY